MRAVVFSILVLASVDGGFNCGTYCKKKNWIRHGDEKLYTSVAANNTQLLKALRGRGESSRVKETAKPNMKYP
jgi:hypothetical protein